MDFKCSVPISKKLTTRLEVQILLNLSVVFVIADNIKAQKSTWFIRDHFIKKNFPAFTTMRERAKVKGSAKPYLFRNFNIDAFHPGVIRAMTTNSLLTHILNSLIYAVNQQQILWRMLIIVPEWDINYFDYGISKIIGANIEWLVREVDRLIRTKKMDLQQKRQGAIVHSETKKIWVKMIQRPNPSRVLALCHKFNAILEETLYKTPGMYILGVDEYLNASHFDQSNYLLEHGKTTYWHSIDKALKQFDNHEGPKLKPERY